MRVAIVDADIVDREQIRSLLAYHEDIEIVAECSNGAEALATIDLANPDVVFVDVAASSLEGLELVEAMEPTHPELRSGGKTKRPAFVFVTACARSAVKAFEIRALDCLLKPLERARFEKTVARARALVKANQNVKHRLLALLDDLHSESRWPSQANRLIVKSGGRVCFLRLEDIAWIEAVGNFVRVHSDHETHLVRASMKNVERRLAPRAFLRIHRSAIVNIDRIRGLTPTSHGEYVATMQDDTRLRVSRVYSHQLDRLLESNGLMGR